MVKLKRLWSLLAMMMVAMLSISVVSCGDDDDDDDSTVVIDDNGDNSGGSYVNNNEPNTTGKLDGHDYVDLGLSVKWATCNVGAFSPESYGSYFAWGETTEKSYYDYSNYAFYKSTNYGFKYTYISGGDISGTRYDAAYSIWGGSWRMPTKAEYDEIENKCASKWITYKGIKGRLFTAPNGNSIFFPAAGEKDDYDTKDLAECGNYWTSTIANHSEHSEDYPWAYSFGFSYNDQFGSGDAGWNGYRSNGMSVRAVYGSSGSGGGTGGGGSSTESLYFTNFNYTATQTSVTVKFYTNERASSATIKYGEYSASSSASATITNKEISATIRGLKKGTKYYVKCTARNSSGSVTSDDYPVMTNY